MDAGFYTSWVALGDTSSKAVRARYFDLVFVVTLKVVDDNGGFGRKVAPYGSLKALSEVCKPPRGVKFSVCRMTQATLPVRWAGNSILQYNNLPLPILKCEFGPGGDAFRESRLS